MAATNFIAPKGGYNAVEFEYLAPLTNNNPIEIRKGAALAAYFLFDSTNDRVKVDKISEYTASAAITLQSHLKYSQTDWDILPDTSDGSDTKGLRLGGGGAVATTRGGVVQIYGNEHATQAGQAYLQCGDVGGAAVNISTAGNQDIVCSTNGSARWRIKQSTGNLESDATNGGDIIFNGAGDGVVQLAEVGVTATGSDQAGAFALTRILTQITGGAVNTGVRLPTPLTGKIYYIVNRSGTTKKIYPASGHTIGGLSANTSTDLAAAQTAIVFAVSATAWDLLAAASVG
jgi:hypothetical protein